MKVDAGWLVVMFFLGQASMALVVWWIASMKHRRVPHDSAPLDAEVVSLEAYRDNRGGAA